MLKKICYGGVFFTVFASLTSLEAKIVNTSTGNINLTKWIMTTKEKVELWQSPQVSGCVAVYPGTKTSPKERIRKLSTQECNAVRKEGSLDALLDLPSSKTSSGSKKTASKSEYDILSEYKLVLTVNGTKYYQRKKSGTPAYLRVDSNGKQYGLTKKEFDQFLASRSSGTTATTKTSGTTGTSNTTTSQKLTGNWKKDYLTVATRTKKTGNRITATYTLYKSKYNRNPTFVLLESPSGKQTHMTQAQANAWMSQK